MRTNAMVSCRAASRDRAFPYPALAVLALAALAGCDQQTLNPLSLSRLSLNNPPDTKISSDTPRQSDSTSYVVHLAWVGSDPDGRVVEFLYAWDDTVDETGHPAWHRTTAKESTFVVTADSCASPPCADPDPCPSPPCPQGGDHPFFGYHTFWIKAVDDAGAPDPTPAHRSFTATTAAPEVTITIGPYTSCVGICAISPEHVYIEWRGEDPDGQVTGYWYKWDTRLDDYPSRWGPDPSADGWTFLPPESTSVASRRQQLYPGCSPRANSFSIFATDDAGAIQQVAECGVNWLCFCPDSTQGGPGLCMNGGLLGIRSTPGNYCDALTGGLGPHDFNRFGFDVVAGTFFGSPVRVEWTRLDPAHGPPPPLIGYRYAIDDSTAWQGPFAQGYTQFPDRGSAPWYPGLGTHAVHVESVDRAGTVDRGAFRFMVSPGPAHRDPPLPSRILLVDDNGHTGDVYYSEWRQVQSREPANWAELLDGFAYDTWDTQGQGAPPVPTVQEYTTVIWNTGIPTGSSPTTTSFLRDDLFKPHAEYLSSYVRAGGNVVIVGMNPMFTMVIRSPGLEGGDLCDQGPAKGLWMFWDPTLCGRDPDEAFPHFLFTRLGIRQMRVPQATYPEAYEQVADRTVRGCTPVDASGVFDRYLGVDPLRAGGDADPTGIRWIPAANVTIPSGLESWATPIYYMDTPDTTLVQNILGIVAIGDQNPRKLSSDPSWGNTALLSVNPYFIRVDDAKWFFHTLLTEVCHEEHAP